ncbi:hypothetical protein CgunFtcFv8_015427 [Champsocephalus gunnari]|uniref:Uncharacterized protein n=1 Tax=Champsocephalus gunnari TaxID=52237 RepID=A0AAN8H3A9_CHAGU|nr:hypothetical protein CgunFtcFv8_015427 [Champsocephalus gunnari]
MLVSPAFKTRLPTRFRPCLSPTCLLCLFPDPACPSTILPGLLSDPACIYADRLAYSLTLCLSLTQLLPAVLRCVILPGWYSSDPVESPIKDITNSPWFLECCIWVLLKTVTVSSSCFTHMDRSKEFCCNDQLFVSWANPQKGKPVTRQRLSHWIVEAIALAYTSQGLQAPTGLRAHSTRGLATSWALFKGVSIQDNCATASWSSPLTFVRFYRLDVSAPSVARAGLGPLLRQSSTC